jgi:prepilin peptidase CpaA
MIDNYFLYIFLGTLLTAASVIDLRIQKIPNLITFPSMIVILAYHTVSGGFDGLVFSFLGLLVGIGVFILPWLLGGMGAGDAKLMGVVGAALGPKGAAITFIFVALAGGVYAVGLLMVNLKYFKAVIPEYIETVKAFVLTKKLYLEPAIKDTRRPRLCYGIAIAAGTFIYIGTDLLDLQVLL